MMSCSPGCLKLVQRQKQTQPSVCKRKWSFQGPAVGFKQYTNTVLKEVPMPIFFGTDWISQLQRLFQDFLSTNKRRKCDFRPQCLSICEFVCLWDAAFFISLMPLFLMQALSPFAENHSFLKIEIYTFPCVCWSFSKYWYLRLKGESFDSIMWKKTSQSLLSNMWVRLQHIIVHSPAEQFYSHSQSWHNWKAFHLQ